jgi:hypothetical protein
MSRKEFLRTANEFSIYGVFRFTLYIVSAVAIYSSNLELAGVSFGVGAVLGFVRRLSRIWE